MNFFIHELAHQYLLKLTFRLSNKPSLILWINEKTVMVLTSLILRSMLKKPPCPVIVKTSFSRVI